MMVRSPPRSLLLVSLRVKISSFGAECGLPGHARMPPAQQCLAFESSVNMQIISVFRLMTKLQHE